LGLACVYLLLSAIIAATAATTMTITTIPITNAVLITGFVTVTVVGGTVTVAVAVVVAVVVTVVVAVVAEVTVAVVVVAVTAVVVAVVVVTVVAVAVAVVVVTAVVVTVDVDVVGGVNSTAWPCSMNMAASPLGNQTSSPALNGPYHRPSILWKVTLTSCVNLTKTYVIGAEAE
jgi:hypothetical protein